MNVAIIPARGGSKRIKNKNIKPFCGKPIIAYAIETAKKANIFDRIIVSTDSKNIQEISLEFGAEVHGLRPKELSDDFATTIDVISYEVTNLGLSDDDIVCCLYPTTPLLKVDFLREGIQKLKKGTYCFSACAFSTNPLRGFFIRNDRLNLLDNTLIESRSQDIENMYFDAGQFYFGYANSFAEKKPIFSEDSTLVVIPEISVTDINTYDDWEIAEIKYKITCKQ